MRHLRTLIIIAIIGSAAFGAGRASAGGVAPPWTFVKDREGVSYLVVNDRLINIPYYPVSEAEWEGFRRTDWWAVPEGDGIGFGACPSWYQHVCDPLSGVRAPITDVIATADEPAPEQPPTIIQRAPAPAATSTPSSSPNQRSGASTFDAGRFIGPSDSFDCNDFKSQAEAQAVLRAEPRDPNRLDPDGDGIACETLSAPRDMNRVPR